MTIATIRTALTVRLDALAVQYGGENEPLSDEDNTAATDVLASALETVNPTNDYPPVPR